MMSKPDTVQTKVSWAVRPPAPPQLVAQLCRELRIPPLLANVLIARGFTGDALSQLQPPLQLSQIPTLPLVAERLEVALRQKKRILIHGDYDADGITGTAVLTMGLRALGAKVIPFIPNRLTDGYGIHPERVREHAELADVFISVDCGISNLEEIRFLQEAGVEVIISDHHQPGTELPDCLVVHPKLSPLAQTGLPELTGAGVAYHLLWALHERLGLPAPLEYSDIASIGIIADVAPLMGENRALITEGLARMAESCWTGLRAALAQSRIKGAPTARDVAFILAPRLNAAGRLGEAELGLELLMTASERRARELAVFLDARNSERRQIQDQMFQDALTKVNPDVPALVLADDSWHPGVMGIVASKLLERFYKPVYIIAQGKGSVRSTPGISAVKSLHQAAAYLKRFGGHSQAAGFAIDSSMQDMFRQTIEAYASGHPVPERLFLADALIGSDEVTSDLFKAIAELEPYGEGHPQPTFVLSDTLDSARAVGASGSTLQLRVNGLKGVAWQQGQRAAELKQGQSIQALISLTENDWNGSKSIEFLAEDIRQAEALQLLESTQKASRIFRGPPDLSEVRHLKCLPYTDGILGLSKALGIQTGEVPVFIDLDQAELEKLESHIAQLPDLQDVRRAYVALQRRLPLPFAASKNDLLMTILREMDLINALGQARQGQKRNPYESEALLQCLLERYTLQSFRQAYLYLDAPSFEMTMLRLFSVTKQAQPD